MSNSPEAFLSSLRGLLKGDVVDSCELERCEEQLHRTGELLQ